MHVRSDKSSKKNLVIDVDAVDVSNPESTSPRARALREEERLARMASALATAAPERAPTFRERHALKVMGTIMAAMFALVLVVQTGC